MLQSTTSRIRLTAVAAVLLGSSVASSVASATSESPPADLPIVEAAPDERYVPTTTALVVESPSEPAPLEPVSDVPVPPDESTMIEPDGDAPSSDDPVVVEASDDPAVVEVPDDPVPDATSQEAGTQQSQSSDPDFDVPSPSGLDVAELGKAGDHTGEPGGGGDDHNESEEVGDDHDESEEEGDHPGASGEDDDHQGCGGGGGGDDQGESGEDDDHEGCGGQGNPYRMTFAVRWYTSSGDQILQLAPEWRSWFKLEAAGQTGSGKATAATCTYSASSNDLMCQFQNPGHDAIVDGMVVPGKPTATYTVLVSGGPGDSNRWSISNANGGPYSARALCPRGDDGGHNDGGHSTESGGGGEVWYCRHTIEMHQLITVPATIDPGEESPSTVPPETEPPPPVPPAEIAPPAVDSPTTMAPVSAVSVTQNTLPATGNSTLTILLIGALMVAIGAMLVAQTRRGRIDGLSRPHDRLVP